MDIIKPKFELGEKVWLNPLLSENPEEWQEYLIVGLIADIARGKDIKDEELEFMYFLCKEKGIEKFRHHEQELIAHQDWAASIADWHKEQEEIIMQQDQSQALF